MYIGFIKKIREALKSNMFYISKELEEKISDILLPLKSKEIKAFDETFYSNFDDEELDKKSKEINIDFYNQQKDNINNLIQLLESEIKLIKIKINFD